MNFAEVFIVALSLTTAVVVGAAISAGLAWWVWRQFIEDNDEPTGSIIHTERKTR